ncbi:unnamed protein product, partial [Iphiclides podalirius]
MHFSIPDVQQFRDDNGITYTGYNIYIDGFYHCTARYKQLLNLHEQLQEFESPYISQKYVRPDDKIVLRKSYWDPCYDIDVMTDRVSLDLLYLQTIQDIDLGWISVNSDIMDLLKSHEMRKEKKEYIELARTTRHYGRVPAGEAVTDARHVIDAAAEGQCRVRVSLASKELTLSSVAQPPREQRYKVTRMRCWRITTLHAMERLQTNGHGSLLEESNKHFELSFEYLISKDHLEWITLRTEHAIFISVCLQSIVDELMRQKSGSGPASPRYKRGGLTYLRRDGSSQLITSSSSSDTLSSVNGDSITSGSSREIFSVQRLTEKFASVAFKSGKDCVENNAFEAIGDEEL